MKTFIKNIRKYYSYAIYAGKAELKSEVVNSYLNWLWWILDPIFFMLIYTFIVQVVFKNNQPNFPVFVFIGLTAWNFFSGMITGSVKLFSHNRNIISKVYIPKYMLLFSKSYIYLFKAMISFVLILGLMCIFKISFTINLLWFIPTFFVLYIITFGISSIVMHFGAYIEDLQNAINIILRMIFYLSGVFYNISTSLPNMWGKMLLKLNPVACIVNEFRKIFMLGTTPDFFILLIWFFLGIFLLVIGVLLVHKYEKGYVKVI